MFPITFVYPDIALSMQHRQKFIGIHISVEEQPVKIRLKGNFPGFIMVCCCAHGGKSRHLANGENITNIVGYLLGVIWANQGCRLGLETYQRVVSVSTIYVSCLRPIFGQIVKAIKISYRRDNARRRS